MKNILFRADAKASIGTGDLISLIHLSKYFERAGWKAHFMTRSYDAGVAIAKKQALKRLELINADSTVQEEVALINNYAEKNDIDVVFFEITERKMSDYKGVSGRPIKACVDFEGLAMDWMDVVVNWDVDAAGKFDTRKHRNTVFLLGMEYAVLPVEYERSDVLGRSYKKEVENVLVTMGGFDEFNYTQKVVDYIVANAYGISLNIIAGSGYQFCDELEKSLAGSGIAYSLHRNERSLLKHYLNCDLAVSSGGLTAFELMATRTPAVLISLYEHQTARCEYFDRMGWAYYSGYRDLDNNVLSEAIKGSRRIPAAGLFKTDDIRLCIEELYARLSDKKR